ncbi:MAG TPA: NADH-quinone oxidoreductase subunit NuoH [Pseudomonadota bacterium]|jgi:NADH-quinone oxidoreductase subunit H|nr:NADH-quinone oxidoreductase subunit NuoH [Pseudomonadota bacterium]HNF97505.1 NADH-quinone oxidoreductase subunit NuoH [Pseudomonadota bacterium]HNI59423.1 NADH-quinone oxidoreductase subunit NuoH [Pseudomonadota bacterium]HNN53545.1 NADH-quinone oxidoreductase subunit NuoH [Pseudomonadota bacterium]HNO68682.1 NADH-quinone oxidoreductase subunit NuoH [Pseudomonadota bacterium]
MIDSILMFLAEHTAVAALLKLIVLVLGFVMPLASLSTWAERRQSAMMQDRLGPNRANIGPIKLWGILHFVADAIKMMFKEDVVPAKVDRFLFALAPVMAIAPVLITFAVIPFGPDLCVGQVLSVVSDPSQCKATIPLQVARMDVGMLFYFALASLAVYGTTLAGWASYNKWSLLGGLRASSQMMSYEVCMGLSLMGAFLVYGSLEPNAIVLSQGSNILNWGIVTQPLAFVLFLTAAIAETKRAPFDLPEGEPELIGYFVEYSGMRFGIFFLAEFIETIFLSAVVTTVFLGGWQVPGLDSSGFGSLHLPHLAVVLIQVVAWSLKILFLCWLQLLIRWTLPRFRPDQLMRLGWKQLLPLSLLNIIITAAVVLWRSGGK